jgi:hypothetical protein
MPAAAQHLAGKLLLVLAAALLTGCSTYRLQGPARVSDPVQVHVLDYGRHASLALPAPDGAWEEWFWGDWNWFAKGRRGVLEGAEALFASRGSALGRRRLPVSVERLGGAAGALQSLCVEVERARAEALQRQLWARFELARTTLVRHPDGREFVFDTARYSLSNTSAHQLARWLRQLGVDVRGGRSPTADFRLETRCSSPRV